MTEPEDEDRPARPTATRVLIGAIIVILFLAGIAWLGIFLLNLWLPEV